MRKLHFILAVVFLGASAGYADDVTDIRRACGYANLGKGIHWLEECAQEAFTADTGHVTLTSVAPGAGWVAFGPGAGTHFRGLGREFMVAGSAAFSTDGSYLGQAQMTFALPSRGFGVKEPALRPLDQKYGMRAINRLPYDDPVDAKISFTLRFRRIDAREQDFYGLGPATTRSALSSYGLILNETYAGANQPLTSWSSLGFDFSFLQPRVTSSISDEPQMRAAYSEATAPGLTVRDDFLRYEPYVTFRVPPQRSTFTTVRVAYAFYHALGDPRLSFQRLSGVSKTSIPLLLPTPSQITPSNRKWLGQGWLPNTICPTVRSAARCSLGDLTLTGMVSAAYTSAGSQVPFYLDTTLGGTNMDGNDVLRGFGNYRFRGPSAVLIQADYRHPVWGPIGLLSFYDTGKVVVQRSDISFAQLRHDIGVGLYFRAGNRELARFYIGFGTGEPARPSFKPSTSF
jgi:hypothetical protein